MVSFWPWKSDTSAASFEKTLSTLATKISKTSASNDSLRQRSRRVRVMWTLYAGFAYILTALILTLVTGWKSWGTMEISCMAGGPILIYIVRTSLSIYYDYRITNTQTYLESLYKERDVTIEKLKAATKYNSTQQLLEKYGSPQPKSKPSSPSSARRKSQGSQRPGAQQQTTTGIAPPPTANIPRPGTSLPSNPQRPITPLNLQIATQPPIVPHGPVPSAEFAPNAFAPNAFAPNAFAPPNIARQYSSSSATTFTESHWYDRIFDALLGEDETQPKNRLALICHECRLVNGQAPPGVRTLEDVGRWRCGGCGAWNGKEKVQDTDIGRLVEGWKSERVERENAKEESEEVTAEESDEEDGEAEVETSESSGVDIAVETVDPTPSRSTRTKSKAQGKKIS
ncbi:hypothetical protein K432DRAFT_431360 [Lepidopterella palustris CBS 459.81]|uniref:Endoplasmic reticulum junction formation protein lunapark n=1 Tax=Lepidopterella palustris CBS 459.81 TaxID=1314670 RepID=A0A8E2JKI1_9PEZI|nr:hypothetical protein K432DRAFT_431360 [Lepidopterella palustris CBS 459.81]